MFFSLSTFIISLHIGFAFSLEKFLVIVAKIYKLLDNDNMLINIEGELMNKYMKIANDLACENLKTNAGGPFGACIIKNGKVIGSGANKVLLKNDPTAHAEIEAIREACKNINSYDLSECVLYTSCYPCPMCLSAIIWANIKTVYYGNTKEDAKNIGFRDDFIYEYIAKLSTDGENSDVLKLICMDREETIKEFEAFANKEDKIVY